MASETSKTCRGLLIACVLMLLPAATRAQGALEPRYPAPERLRLLIIAEPHGLPGTRAVECAALEALSNLRFTWAEGPHEGGDHALDVSALFGRDPRLIQLRKDEILRRLRQSWDLIVYSPGRNLKQLDIEIQQALAAAVQRGERLLWLAGKMVEGRRGYPVVDPGLAGMLPFQGEGEAAAFGGIDPLAYQGLEEAGLAIGRRARPLPVGNGFAVVRALPSGRRGTKPFLVYRRFGKGAVLALQTGGSLFPELGNAAVDGDLLWARAFERLVAFARQGSAPPPVQLEVEQLTGEALAPPRFRVKLSGPAGAAVRLEQQDQRGTRHVLSASVKLTPDGATIEAVGAPSPYDWQAIMATPLAGKVASGTALVQLRRPVDLQLETVRQGMPPGFETESRLRLTPHVDLEGARLHWSVRDWAGRVVCVANEAIALRRDEPVERSFAFKPTDPDPRAYAYWLQAAVRGPAGELVSRAETTLYRYRPYDLGEQLLLATWHTEPASQRRSYSRVFLRHLRELGFNAVFGFRDLDAVERENFRLYAEHQASTRLGVGAANFKQAIEGYPERYQTEGKRRSQRFAVGAGDNAWPTAALNMFSMGEESGYGRWSESYPWRDKEAAPEECNKWFRHYLRTRYRDLAALNQAWGKDFKDWQELKVWRRYAQPYGWMFVAPPAEPERNLTPSVDTHAFHEWYFEEYARNYMRGFNQANPVPSWTLSYDFTFVQFTPSPMSNWYCALPPEGVALWHAYVRPRTPGPANPFHLDWMFFEDEPMNNQFLQMGIALGATYLSTWGHVFNADLTPTRPGITAAKTMRALERPEAAIRKMRPHFDGRVGIYTFDSRWKLVRGRYGYYLHRRGPNDISLGPGPHKAPGASYTRAAEGPLYEALLASGYSPLFMKPEDFSKAKIIFMPYVEAIDRATALALRRFVENGGTLISFPVIAQYDGGGKPYAAYPGAGLDELFGFRAKRQWLMGRYPVDFPGENAARQAFDKVWFRGDDKDNEKPEKEQEAALPLFFKFSMRMGGDPCHYLPEGHEALEALAEDVVVLGRHQDGQPLITYRKVGQGQALCFNVLLTWGSGLANPATEQRETFRQVIDQLVRRFGVEPDFSFQNIRSYGEGINDFTTVQYDLPGANTRILALFSDYRARRADAKLTLHGRYRQVWDVLAGERLVALPNAKGEPESVVVVKPANWRILALTPDEPPAPTLTVAGRAELGRPHALAIGPRGRGAAYGRVEVAAPNGEVMAHHSRSIALKADEELVLRPRLDDPPGAWRVRYTDAVTGKSATAVLPVAAVAGVAARTLPAADAPLTSRVLAARGPEITAGEFLGLLAQLRRCHLAPGPVDKRAYGYYCYELTDSRHRTDQLLAAVDWPGQVQALRRYVAGGERLYLVGEDLGYEPRSGIKCTPARNPRILTALSQLLAGEGSTARLGQLSGRPYLRLIKLGRGLIVLDRRSPDAAGNSNLHLAAFHQQWLVEMKELGLLPGGADPELLPVGGESLEQWFFKGGTLR